MQHKKKTEAIVGREKCRGWEELVSYVARIDAYDGGMYKYEKIVTKSSQNGLDEVTIFLFQPSPIFFSKAPTKPGFRG